jgi:pyrroline-5-carboxylate reductase
MSRVGFIGFGRMGRALASGAISSGVVAAKNVLACDPNAASHRLLRKWGSISVADNASVVQAANMVFLCVKPQAMPGVLNELSQRVPLARRQKVCFVSIAAGLPLKRLEKELGPKVPVLRVMPNTPALLKAGMSGLSRGRSATVKQEASVLRLLHGVGDAVIVPERWMDAVTAVSGSGPAYVFYVAEAMMEAATALKLPADLARRLAHQTIYGAGRMLAERPDDAAELRRQVTSPKGTTAAAIEELDRRHVKEIFKKAIQKAARRAAALAQ